MVGSTLIASQKIIEGWEPLVKGRPLYDRYDEVLRVIGSRFPKIDHLMSIFARPEVLRGNGSNDSSVAWYTTRGGNLRRWRDLDHDAQTRIASLIAVTLERLRPLFADAEIGDDLQRWMNFANIQDDLYIIEHQPVLVGWGLLDPSLLENPQAREALHARGLGRFADWLSLPPFLPSETMGGIIEGGPSTPVPHGDIVSHITLALKPPLSTGPNTKVDPQPNPAERPAEAETHILVDGRRYPWLAVAIALVIAIILFCLLLIPGVLQFNVSVPGTNNGAIEQSEAILRKRIADLQYTMDHGVCTSVGKPDTPLGTLIPPVNGRPPVYHPEPAAPPVLGSIAPTQVDPPLQQVQIPPMNGLNDQPAAQGDPTNVVDLLDQAAVLVVAPEKGGGGNASTGSGFFINQTDILTNRHVIAEADPAKVFVVNKALGKAVLGRVVASTPSSDVGGPDFALIRLDHPPAHPTLSISPAVQRAQNVTAYGYPGFVMESDIRFKCLLEGDPHCVPVGAITEGYVTVIQTTEQNLDVIAHSANISEGNSGGPLIDVCGRVVGINTYVNRDNERVQQLNFALPAPAIATFLTAQHVDFKNDPQGCRLAASAPPATGSAPSARPLDPQPGSAPAAPSTPSSPGKT